MKRKQWHLQKHSVWSPEGYWASYSDLMAGILLVFAVASAGSMMMLKKMVLEPTESLRQWQEFVTGMCTDPGLNTQNARVDCNTGRLIISEESLRFGLNKTDLKPEGQEVLLSIVPDYLDRVRQYKGFDERLKGIEISGHTDATGEFQTNVDIGTARAANVLKFLIESPQMKSHAGLLKEKAFSAGYADTVPPIAIPRERRPENWPDARRIEIQIHLDDAEILKELKNLLDKIR